MPEKNQYPDIIALVGFMGTGKTTVGRVLAKKLNYSFVDLDRFIEDQQKCSIAELFAKKGEAHFRKLETQALKKTLSLKHIVIACGGGILETAGNTELIFKKTYPVLLKASADLIAQRTQNDRSRPLLKGDKKSTVQIKKLLELRNVNYQQVDLQVSVDNLTPVQVTKKILASLSISSEKLSVELGEKTYPIYFFNNQRSSVLSVFEKHTQSKKLIIVTNTRVAPLYLAELKKSLSKKYEVDSIIIPDGERYKTLKTVEKIYHQLIELGADRKTTLVALGGGVVGDITGFVAGTFLRGVDFVQIPTTLLAQVDSSVGGKTGVDLKEGKNLVGVFLQPKFVFIDVSYLKTLELRQFKAGMAEVIKYGAIWDRDLFDRLVALAPYLSGKLADQNTLALPSIIRRCCEIKAEIVALDEFETKDLRSLLNFGHTLGHAVEALTGYHAYLHGEAVALGMLWAANFSMKRKRCSKKTVGEMKAILESYDLQTQMPRLNKKELKAAIGSDKKRVSSNIKFVYLKKIGEAFIQETKITEIIK